MALTNSTMQELGTRASSFTLPDVRNGKKVSLQDFNGKNLLVMFICKHCPYVKHVEAELSRIGKDYADKEISIVAISSNDAEKYPDDAPESLATFAESSGFVFPLLYDETQSVAKSYSAVCTPDFFLYDAAHKLVYRGQLDDSRPGNNQPVTGKDLRAALDSLLSGNKVDTDQKPSAGCNIKWKPGNEPKF
ncbi:MAG TPA: thioredoxin family protein [Oculatellaceae cyanobacterium]